MHILLQYVVAGLVIGSIYAIASVSIVFTYVSTGILNFAFASMAFFVARTYYYFHSQAGWPIWAAALISILVIAPALGALLWAVLFRFLSASSTMAKVVALVGVSVALPPLTTMMFGERTILSAPGLAPSSATVYHPLGVPVTLDQIIVFGSVIAVVIVGTLILRGTAAGLVVRALVDSRTMTRLVGTNPQVVELAVWATGSLLAGLAGVLMAPVIGLDPDNFTLLIAGAFAAVVVARLRNLGVALVAALALGVVGSVIQKFIPQSSTLARNITPAVPFAFVLVFLVIYSWRGRRAEDRNEVAEAELAASFASTEEGPAIWRHANTLVIMAAVAILPLFLHGTWVGLVGEGLAFAIAFLSYTVITGEGGVISLCQITYAGVGGIVTAQLATNHGWPVLLAVLAGGVIAIPIGAIIGFLTLRLGDLYVALVTLTFGLLMDNIVFKANTFYQFGIGVNVPRPSFAQSDLAFTYLTFVAFCIVGLLIVNLRRSTTGLAVAAVRWSEPGARSVGLSVVQLKLLAFALGAFVAAIAGGFLAMYSQASETQTYATFGGLVWLAIIVANGVRNNSAAVIAGLSFSMFPAIVVAWFPHSLNQLPTALFGLAGIGVARQPAGWVAHTGASVRALFNRTRTGTSPEEALAPELIEREVVLSDRADR